jgi:uncharacterized membrane protein
MALRTATVDFGVSTSPPRVRKIGMADIGAALAEGFDDFRALPSQVIFLGIIYPVVGLILGRLAFGYDVLPLLFPLVAGFALLGPLAAIGLYELSRRREQGLDAGWRHAFDVLRAPAIGAIAALGVVLALIFIAWLAVANLIYDLTLGAVMPAPASLGAFVSGVFSTTAGWQLIILGNLVGFVFALATFVISAVSFPLLLDRDGGALAAVQTSIRAVRVNPRPMLAWGFVIALALVIGSIPFLLGLAVVMPILGHASWHLYRKVVA